MSRTQKFFRIFLFLIIPFLVSGYGYMGDLPELGKESRDMPAIQPKDVQKLEQIKPISIIAPRVNAGHNINKYNDYLSDIKQIEYLLKELKTILQKETKNKVQLYCAKVHLFNLYVDVFENKYNDRPEKYYESYKQLLVLDKYLTEISDYKIATDRLRETQRGSLKDKIEDEKFLRQKVDKAIIPINTVIAIIEDSNN